MTKLDLEIVVVAAADGADDDPAKVQSLRCRTSCATTATVLGINVGLHHTVPVAQVLSDALEVAALQTAVERLVRQRQKEEEERRHRDSSTGSSRSRSRCFESLNLVLSAPGVDPTQDRSPIDDVFANPVQAIHVCGELQLACFVHLELRWEPAEADETESSALRIIRFTGLEYSRSHRQRYLRQEFGSWLLEEHIESSVIATTMQGQVCFWNRFATELYGYSREEAMGQSVMELTPSEMTQEQAVEIFAKLSKGEHWKVRRVCVRACGGGTCPWRHGMASFSLNKSTDLRTSLSDSFFFLPHNFTRACFKSNAKTVPRSWRT
jgi:PAS domain-containing protein